ncbi:hypothetical protein [Spirochaeta cellobiosiphila]|uniref:hypothetical protein n=1 Tax=Spirochaeta cellobiosiphila TaxID=504483 RepID=UPI000400F448|nr:hypothetical protein [Spirochaeta cellobiosiphila]
MALKDLINKDGAKLFSSTDFEDIILRATDKDDVIIKGRYYESEQVVEEGVPKIVMTPHVVFWKSLIPDNFNFKDYQVIIDDHIWDVLRKEVTRFKVKVFLS